VRDRHDGPRLIDGLVGVMFVVDVDSMSGKIFVGSRSAFVLAPAH
jgi:hypothetical protein